MMVRKPATCIIAILRANTCLEGYAGDVQLSAFFLELFGFPGEIHKRKQREGVQAQANERERRATPGTDTEGGRRSLRGAIPPASAADLPFRYSYDARPDDS